MILQGPEAEGMPSRLVLLTESCIAQKVIALARASPVRSQPCLAA